MKDGYYWARWHLYGGGLDDWEPVQVTDGFVYQMGSDVTYEVKDFDFDPNPIERPGPGSPETLRPETGVMQFEGDWPGIFIRGDDALAYGLAVKNMLNTWAPTTNSASLSAKILSLPDLLKSCDARLHPDDVQAARLTQGQESTKKPEPQ